MRYLALALDYDGTLALDGRVDASTIEALERVVQSGRRLLLVTGRELDDLQRVFGRLDLFEYVVAENGALLYRPAARESIPVGEAPPGELVRELRRRGVAPLSVGSVIVATWRPNETAVLETIRDLGLEWQVIFNKGAVMALPSGVNKGSGLSVALKQMGLSPHNVAGIGDAENDHAFLSLCECAVAVANALPAVQERADVVTRADHGAGVIEFIERLLGDDLASLENTLQRHHLPLGKDAEGVDLALSPHGTSLLIAGSSGAGKSTIARALLERLRDARYQFCVIDPEGDYGEFPGAVTFGDTDHPPNPESVLQLLEAPESNAVVNLLGVALADRPQFFAGLLPQLLDLRLHTGHPHWLLIDEAHHMFPEGWAPAQGLVPRELGSMVMVTVHPEMLARPIAEPVDVVIGVGDAGADTVSAFAKRVGDATPPLPDRPREEGEALVWLRRRDRAPFYFRSEQPRDEQHRHRRKYAQGDVGDKSFFFRGPEGKLNLRAQNLALFAQIAEGVDDGTWLHHLRQGDYSRWFREAIKDEELAFRTEQIEAQQHLRAFESRAAIIKAIEDRYTAPAERG